MTNARPEDGTGAVVNVPGGHDHDTAQRPEIAEQLDRRRLAERRDSPIPKRRDRQPADPRELDSWARALAYLDGVGLPGLPPANVRRALAADPERYAAVLPRRTAA